MRKFFVGSIAIWSGLLASIPKGWALCDGTNGTPDLRDKFVQGAAAGMQPGATGGISDHTHNLVPDIHQHFFDPGADVISPGSSFVGFPSAETIVGVTDSKDGRPPFFEVVYIMDTGVI